MIQISKTPDQLILRDRPWVLGLGLIAAMLIFAAIGLNKLFTGNPGEAGKLALLFGIFALVFVVFVQQVIVRFDRAAQLVTIRTVTVFRQTDVQHALTGLVRAEKERGPSDSDGRGKTTWRTVLVFAEGEKLPLTSIFSSGNGAQTCVTAINSWLSEAKPRRKA